MAVNFKTKKDTGPRINEQITASEVRLISSSGKQMGILSIREALIQAEDEGFDLVEVSPEANPPVCKIIDYGKLKYREQKSKKEAKKKQKTIEVKEIKMRPGIDTHDYNVKIKALSKFIGGGNKVKVLNLDFLYFLIHSHIFSRFLEGEMVGKTKVKLRNCSHPFS